MGNSSSSYNYEAAVLASTKESESIEIGKRGEEEKSCGLPRTSKAAPNGVLTTCADYGNNRIAKTLWEAFQLGLSNNAQGNFLATREFKVDTNPPSASSEPAPAAAAAAGGGEEEKAAAAKKKKKPSGYVEREDGTINRFNYVFDTYADVETASTAIGRGLLELGAKPNDNIGIFCINRSEWVITSLALYSQSMRTVALYATLGPDAVEYIINHAETAVVFVSKENLPSLKKVVGKISMTVKHIVLIDSIFNGRYGNTLDVVPQADIDFFGANKIKLHGLSSLISLGTGKQNALTLPKSDDLAFIMYTSGTTGVPKGAMISHGNVMAAIGSLKSVLTLNQGDVYFSYLPLAHIFESVAQVYIWTMGGVVYFSQGDIRRLADDLGKVRPMLFCGVPRVFQKFYQTAWQAIGKRSCPARWYISRAYRYQCDCLRNDMTLDPSYDSGVFSILREKMGLDRVKCLVTGAAPCPPYLLEFMRVVTNAYFAQGYGMTESTAATCIQLKGDNLCGTVGPPLPNSKIMLKDIPDMKYNASDLRGEILIGGPSVFKGYFKNAEVTAETLIQDSNGETWLMTGDVGRWNPNGSLSIIDRKKNMIKLTQGEYVAVEKVEDIYGKASCISQIWCYGNSYKSVMIGVVVPSSAATYDYCIANGILDGNAVKAPVQGNLSEEFRAAFKDIFKGPHKDKLKAWITSQLAVEEAALQGFEKMKDFHIESDLDVLGQGFNEENDCLTPTMKKKRKPLTEKYLPILKSLYTKLGEAPADGEKW